MTMRSPGFNVILRAMPVPLVGSIFHIGLSMMQEKRQVL
jgi:hypothetical protein